MRHFATKREARKFLNKEKKINSGVGLHLFKKVKGHKNRIKKPFVVGSFIEWLNLN